MNTILHSDFFFHFKHDLLNIPCHSCGLCGRLVLVQVGMVAASAKKKNQKTKNPLLLWMSYCRTRIAHCRHTKALQRVLGLWAPGMEQAWKTGMVASAFPAVIPLRDLLFDTSQIFADSRWSQLAPWNCDFSVAGGIIRVIKGERKDRQVRKSERTATYTSTAAFDSSLE